MDDELKLLLEKLGRAINESLQENDSIALAIGKIKKVGYEVCLFLDATVVFEKREPSDVESTIQPFAEPTPLVDEDGLVDPTLLNPQDIGFLGDLNIRFDDEK